ncbi:alpha-amylase family glycosyl hydrolase [Marinilabilia salmonicolor]|uniref:Putative secreted protein (Por secretion system target) n=1 Tax=Marinilabilia salmonicolor TaxID=989 RepID=A0A2T0XA38_9BACT|nr:alpha-amylase family glycosyl hydrolase [Marinilabilia salmonicolor]PRY95818.1 putative secreted protein (Por secretion system target) [Marinilabilia salmonicolor]RCW36593.1 putative secreted protein (Por secretion system target) [Marinilabilia salmonicolor]
MLRSLSFLWFLSCFQMVSAQVISTQPAIPVEGSEIVVTFDATQGTGGLEDYTGDVYAHTGVITSESTGDSDWKYVVADWGVNVEKAKLTRVADNAYELTITPDIRTFYEVPEGEEILKMAFVFRSEAEVGGSWKEGKDEGGKDILVDVYSSGLTALLAEPADGALFSPGALINVTGQGQDSENLELFFDDASVESSTTGELTYSFNAPNEGSHQLILVASAGTETDADTVNFYIQEPVVAEPRPEGLKNGVNIIDENTVTLLLQAPEKEFVYVLGDFNSWEPRPDAQMKKDGEFFWLTITGLTAGEEYAYQYYIDGEVKIADPYTNKVLDPWNDRYISEDIYPGLKPYPTAKGADGIVSVFTTTPDEYVWKTADFVAPATEDLVIYELLIRDFTSAQDIKTVTDTLDYLQRLGVNAIELMPFNEFEGNDSWGYNPSFYFATDKAYGTANDYKEFVDECHARGIAVIMDMVLNHSFGQSPLARMYWDGGKPAANNPWYNRDHNMANPDAQWGYDFDHDSEYTRELVDSINSYWMSEFRIDGFRFDFTKGFTNTPYGTSSWASDYDASRIAILKRMTNEIWARNSDAIVIFEHLSDNSEETELANHGILLWGNMNHSFSEGVMGYNDGGASDFSWASYQRRGWDSPNVVAYMESHDEERVMYRALNFGDSSNGYDVRELETAILRSAMASTFLMSIPGPKMIWQFGELGYDVSIDDGGRLGQKPPKWDYQEDYARESLWNFYAEMIQLRKNHEVFATADFEMDVAGSVKRIALNGAEVDVRLVGNFGLEKGSKEAFFSRPGWWYNHFQGDSINVTNENMMISLRPGEFVLYTSEKLPGFRNVTSTGPDVFENANGTSVFPNPVENKIYIETLGNQQVSGVVVYDFSGRVVFEESAEGKNSYDLSSLATGLYLMEISTGKDSSSWHKIIKE